MKKAVFLIAPDGFQDYELKTPFDTLQNNGYDCTIASTTLNTATGSLGTKINPDIIIDDINTNDYDILIIVGGPGAPRLGSIDTVIELIQAFAKQDKYIAAICIAPTILAKAGILKGIKSTVWKSEQSVKQLHDGGAEFVDIDVVIDGKIITGNGPKAAKNFAQKIIETMR